MGEAGSALTYLIESSGFGGVGGEIGVGFGTKVPYNAFKLNSLDEVKEMVAKAEEFIDYQLERAFRDSLRKTQIIAYEMKLRGIRITRKQKQDLQELSRDV